MFFKINIKCLILYQVAVMKVFDQKEVAFKIRELLIIEHEHLHRILLPTSPLYTAMHHSIWPFPEFLSNIVFLGENLDVFEGRDHWLFVVLDACPVIGMGIGWTFNIHAYFFLYHSLVSAEEGKPFELTFNSLNVMFSWNSMVVLAMWKLTYHSTSIILIIINTAAEKVRK